MYEMVMLVAMTASVESPAFFRKKSRGGCSGVVYSGCSGCSGYVPVYGGCGGCGGVVYSGCGTVVNGCGGYIPSGTVVYSGGSCCGTIISITPIEPGKNGGDKPAPGKELSADEKKWLEFILKNTEGAKEKKEAEAYFKGANAAERKKYYEDIKKEVDAATPKPVPVTAEEQKLLDFILKNTEGAKEKKEAEEYFKSSNAAERKKYYDDIKKEVDAAKPKELTADEKTWLAYILKNTEGAKEKKEAEEYFKSSTAADRKKYYDDIKKEVEGK